MAANGDTPSFADTHDIYQYILKSNRDDEFLEASDLGLGNYGDQEFWQQIRSYRKGLFADTAFAEVLLKRGIEETKIRLAREGFDFYDEDSKKDKHWDPYDELSEKERGTLYGDDDGITLREHGEEIWSEMGRPDKPFTEEQLAALLSLTNVDRGWRPVFWRMLQARHEASRSRGARLLDNALADVQQLRDDEDLEY